MLVAPCCAAPCPQAFKLNVTAVISQRQRCRLPALPRAPDHLPGRPVFRLRRWAAAARGRTWPPAQAPAGTVGGEAAAAAAVKVAAGSAPSSIANHHGQQGQQQGSSNGANNGSSSVAGSSSVGLEVAAAAGGIEVRDGEAAVAAAAAAAAGSAPFPGQHVYISHDSNDDDEYLDADLAAADLAIAELEVAGLDDGEETVGTGDSPAPLPAPAGIGFSSGSGPGGGGSFAPAAEPDAGHAAGGRPIQAQPALLHCRTHVTMAVRVPRALRVVPNALLGYAGGCRARCPAAALSPCRTPSAC